MGFFTVFSEAALEVGAFLDAGAFLVAGAFLGFVAAALAAGCIKIISYHSL